MSEVAVRAAFDFQADWARRLGSPFTERLLGAAQTAIDRSTSVGRRVLDWPGDPVADALVLRLLGGLNGLVRDGALPLLASAYPPKPLLLHDNLVALLVDAFGDERLLPWLDVPPQTNEVARSGVLMPGLMVVAAETGLPLRLFELGASAGLNLRVDRYGYDLGGVRVRPPGAPFVLAPAWTGPPPPAATVTVMSRRGVDRVPVDLTSDRQRLLAYVWPDQVDRVARLEGAIVAFQTDPLAIDRHDAADWVDENVTLLPGAATVVFHSIAFQYFSATSRRRIEDCLAALGDRATRDAPLAWLRFEFEAGAAEARPTLRLRLWPDGEDRLLARAHPHGASVTWLG